MTGAEALETLRIRLWLLALDVDRGVKQASLMTVEEAQEFDMTEQERIDFNRTELDTDYIAEYARKMQEWEAYCLLFKAVGVELSLADLLENGPQHDFYRD